MHRESWSWGAVVAATVWLVACSGDEGQGQSSSAATGTGDMSSSAGSVGTGGDAGPTTGDSGADGSSTTAASGGSGGDPGPRTCVETCDFPSDCCPGSGEGMCPGAFPYNVDCVDGLCVPAVCADDGDCTLLGEGLSCHPVGGHPACVLPCEADPSVCIQPNSGAACSRTADDGTDYCFEGCDAGLVSCGNQTCDPMSGLCTCETSGQCLNGWECV